MIFLYVLRCVKDLRGHRFGSWSAICSVEFQTEIDKENNARSLESNLSWKKTPNGILILFPETLKVENISGTVFLYRPSNKKFDFETKISLSDHNLLIPDNRLLDGRWNIKVDWTYDGTAYLFKKEIIY